MPSQRIMVIDDELGVREMLDRLLTSFGYAVTCYARGEDALKALRKEPSSFSLVITDLKMESMGGMEVLSAVKKTDPLLPVIMITGYATIESAVEAMKMGAHDYISKPFEADSMEVILKKAIDHKELQDENIRLKEEVDGKYKLGNIIGKSSKMVSVYELIKRVAPSDSSVLILGDSGTGKELIAKAIHYNSPRIDQIFLSINCSAFPETLLESELFGYEKGAFTGAQSRKKGILEAAHEGTLFLDEIGDMPFSLQSKMLRAIEEKEFLTVGGRAPVKVDVRFISSTNKDLEQEMQEGRFRADLYYRLNVVVVQLPPLCERREDIPLLVSHFLQKYSAKSEKKIDNVSPMVMNLFMRYPWPGNIRELENIIERAVIMTYGQSIEIDDLPENLRSVEYPLDEDKNLMPLKMAKRQFERQYLVDLLKRYGGNISKAAREAHIHRTQVHEKIKSYHIKEEEYS